MCWSSWRMQWYLWSGHIFYIFLLFGTVMTGLFVKKYVQRSSSGSSGFVSTPKRIKNGSPPAECTFWILSVNRIWKTTRKQSTSTYIRMFCVIWDLIKPNRTTSSTIFRLLPAWWPMFKRNHLNVWYLRITCTAPFLTIANVFSNVHVACGLLFLPSLLSNPLLSMRRTVTASGVHCALPCQSPQDSRPARGKLSTADEPLETDSRFTKTLPISAFTILVATVI